MVDIVHLQMYLDIKEMCLPDLLEKGETMSHLKEEREKKRLTQAKLAELSGVSLRMISYYERGYKDINKAQADSLYKLAKTLNCSMEDLMEPVE